MNIITENKIKITKNFANNLKGKKFNPAGFNANHDGKEGHWVERQLGVKANSANKPDLLGFEVKKEAKSKITFGDWSPSVALWKNNKPYANIKKLDRDEEFLVYFGKPNDEKNGRFSWSGEPIPKINVFNSFGQIMRVQDNGDVVIMYSFEKDNRPNKERLIPSYLKKNDLVLAKWLHEDLKRRVEDKFNDNGFLICFKDSFGAYVKIGFGDPFCFRDWLELVKTGDIYFDSGMKQGNPRPYSPWRANNNIWHNLVKEVH
jgi:hypothetical protein